MDFAAIVDRFLIRELIDEYSNVCTLKDWDRLGELFVDNCTWRTSGANERSFVGKDAIVAAIRAVVEGYPLIFQMPHAPRIRLLGDAAESSTLMHEFGRLDDTRTAFTYAVYHDRLVRTGDGWKFVERVFEGRYQASS